MSEEIGDHIELIRKEVFEHISAVGHFLSVHDYQSVRDGICGLSSMMENIKDIDDKSHSWLLFAKAGLLFELGSDTNDSAFIDEAIELMTSNERKLCESNGSFQYYYNLGNMFASRVAELNSFELTIADIDGLLEAKNCYRKASKSKDIPEDSSDIRSMLFVNLGNSLKRMFRLSEALWLYDTVLDQQPHLFEVHCNYAESLHYVEKISGHKTITMLQKCLYHYQRARELCPSQNDIYFENIEKQIVYYQKTIDELCTGMPQYIGDIPHIQYQLLDDFPQFCLDYCVSLSEHGMYCKCNGSSKDDLAFVDSNDKEIIEKLKDARISLEEIKAKFLFTKYIIFEVYELRNSINESESISKSIFENGSMSFSQSTERTRQAFSNCFSVLDKIAGILVGYFKWPGVKENFQFLNIWRIDANPVLKQQLCNLKNPGLLALYSIKTDLYPNKDRPYAYGEFAHLKDWRNAIEHNRFRVYEQDPTVSNDNRTVNVSKEHFQADTMQLMQLTRSAIFSVVWAINWDIMKPEISMFYKTE